MLEAGAKVPNVAASDDTGAPVKLRDLTRDHATVVLYFYPRANTPGCTDETMQFRDLYRDFGKRHAKVLGVSRDSVDAQAKFKAKFNVPFPLLADVDSKICDAFGVIVEKKLYGKTSLGIQRSTFVIKDGTVAHVWPKVKVEGHAAEVLRSL